MAENTKKQLKKYRSAFLILFLFLLFLIPGVHFLTTDRTFSRVENRPLQQVPVLSYAAVKDGSYMKDLTAYLEDQFPGRDQFIRLKARLEFLTLRMENNDVFIASGRNLIDKFRPNPGELTLEKAAVINGFAKEHSGMKVSVMLVPTKSEIYRDELPPAAPVASQKEYKEKFYSLLSGKINQVDLFPALTDHRDEYLFFRSDHHWTQEGAFIAQEKYLLSIGQKPRKREEYEVKKVDLHFLGSLTSKSGIAPTAADEVSLHIPVAAEDIVVNLTQEQQKLTSFYQLDSLEGQDKYLVFLGGNYPVVRVSTASPMDRRLLIIKDSFANAFVPFLTRAFSEITMVDLRYYTGDINRLAEEYLITDTLILYNINTFNDDHSILNIGDTLSENALMQPPAESGRQKTDKGESAAEGLSVDPPREVSIMPNLHIHGQFYVSLKNNTNQEIAYTRRIKLEIQTDAGWKSLTESRGFSWNQDVKKLPVGSKAEYLLDLEKAFGPLQEGRYRLTQTFLDEQKAMAEFSFSGSS